MSGLSAGKRRFVKRALGEQPPTVWIGKDGASEHVVGEIMKQLNKNKMVKVKILKSALADEKAKQIADKIAERVDATLVEIRGHTFMLYKPRGK